MKFLRLLLFILTTGILFTSCQKEFSAETGSAQGTLVKDAANNCTAAVNGAYKKDTLITAANYVDVQVDFAQVGIYIINTDTVNGYYFRAAGAAAVTGLNTVRLFGTGKPIAVGTDIFKVHYGTSICEFSTNVTIGTGGGGTTTAVFTFPNAAACTGAVQTPNFFVGIPTIAAVNTMTLLVNVTQAGTYTLTTTPANGLTFMGSGTLAVGNNQPIVLGASGTPASPAGTINYTFSTTTPVASSCGFGLTVQAAPTPAAYTINCATAATQTGTFQVGTALTATSKITLSVTPTTTGAYSITTNTVNGVSYVGAGIFTTTATQNVDLFANPANNTPAAVGAFNYTTTGGTAACNNVSVTYAAGGGAGTAVYTIGSVTGQCSATVNGIFTQGVSSVGNTVVIAITVQTPGTFTLTTGLFQGLQFTASGNLSASTTSITLIASGIPTISGTFPYPLFTSPSNICGFNINILPGGGGGGATDSVSATVNGVFVDFDLLPAIQMDNTSFPPYTALVISSDNSLNFFEAVQFGVGNLTGGNLPTGTYTVNQGPAIFVGGQYTDGANIDFLSTTITTATNPTPPFTVTITSITGGVIGASGTRVKGSFSGALKETTPGTGVKTITGGYFDLTFP